MECRQCKKPFQSSRRFYLSFIADDQSNILKTISDELVKSKQETIEFKKELAIQQEKVKKLRANVKMVKEVHLYTKLIENSELIKRIGKRDYKIVLLRATIKQLRRELTASEKQVIELQAKMIDGALTEQKEACRFDGDEVIQIDENCEIGIGGNEGIQINGNGANRIDQNDENGAISNEMTISPHAENLDQVSEDEVDWHDMSFESCGALAEDMYDSSFQPENVVMQSTLCSGDPQKLASISRQLFVTPVKIRTVTKESGTIHYTIL